MQNLLQNVTFNQLQNVQVKLKLLNLKFKIILKANQKDVTETLTVNLNIQIRF